MLLRSLAVSRFVHSGAAVVLTAAIHQRTWDRAYLQTWRALQPRVPDAKPAHAYEVLRISKAAAPPLAVARARALFLQKLTLHGPSVIRTFLYEHWIACPQGAWLSQLTDDVKLITLYVPAIQGMVSEGAAVHDLLDSFEADPTWWPKQTKRAERAFQKALDDWATQRQNAVVASESCPVETCTEPPPQPVPLPFACHACNASFPLRKHLGVHLARAHGIISPSRHYTFDVYCHACHRWFGTIRQVQQHLKHSGSCLLRVSQVLPALTLPEVRELEKPEVAQAKKVAQGSWRAYTGHSQRTLMYGPPLPTFEERCLDLDFYAEDVPLYLLGQVYRPTVATATWIQLYVEGRSVEGPRATSKRYWHMHPSVSLNS